MKNLTVLLAIILPIFLIGCVAPKVSKPVEEKPEVSKPAIVEQSVPLNLIEFDVRNAASVNMIFSIMKWAELKPFDSLEQKQAAIQYCNTKWALAQRRMHEDIPVDQKYIAWGLLTNNYPFCAPDTISKSWAKKICKSIGRSLYKMTNPIQYGKLEVSHKFTCGPVGTMT